MIRKAVILSTGDEIVSGLTVDTNSSYLADKLFEIGVDLVAVLTVGDDRERIRWSFERGLDLADLVLATGGLGPTADDLTTETLAATLGRTLVFDPDVAERIRQMFRAMNRGMPQNNLRQANFPEGAVIVPNPLGTAPGYRIEVDWKGAKRFVVVLPGVPREMKRMAEESVFPWIRSQDESGETYASLTFQTFGASESALDALLENAIAPEEGKLSFRASFPQISVRLTVRGQSDETAKKLAALGSRVRDRIGPFVFGEGSATMEGVVGDLLRSRGWKLAVAESCTGGLIAQRLTSVPGSSDVFVGGIIGYASQVKTALLSVPQEILDRHGAVSEETARAMAEGVLRACRADVAISVTGIAGPGGGSAEKPVGTVCLALAAADTVVSRRYQLWGNREWIRLLASQIALDWVRRQALGFSPADSLRDRR